MFDRVSLVGQAICDRLGDILTALEQEERKTEEIGAELGALGGQVVEPEKLRQAVEEFNAMWGELFPRERARVLALLLEAVEFKAGSEEVRLTFPRG